MNKDLGHDTDKYKDVDVMVYNTMESLINGNKTYTN